LKNLGTFLPDNLNRLYLNHNQIKITEMPDWITKYSKDKIVINDQLAPEVHNTPPKYGGSLFKLIHKTHKTNKTSRKSKNSRKSRKIKKQTKIH
jgi:hypothetical protein